MDFLLNCPKHSSMRIFFSEAPPDYETYTFPYAIYAEMENNDLTEEVYRRGFLPYSDIRYIPEGKILFYLSRSIRIDLQRFELTSENRRIRKKMANTGISFEVVSKKQINFYQIKEFVQNYVHQRIGNTMSEKRLHYIFHHPLMNKIAVFGNETKTTGYVWLVENNKMRHYWFAFFDTALMSYGIGKWMMEQMISDAKEQGMHYIYLGTCYGPKALYKIRDFKAVEYFDGNRWISAIKHLKHKCKDQANKSIDDFKRNPESFF